MGEIAPVVLGDRNYWLPDIQASLREKGIILQAPFHKAHSPQAPAYQSSVLGQVRYRIDTVFAQLTDRVRAQTDVGVRSVASAQSYLVSALDAYPLRLAQPT
jgi:hypothetical protein